MILHTEFDGGASPFEGTRDLVLRGLPADARVLSARATIAAVDPNRLSGGRDPFAEEIRFPATSSGPGATGDWGATQVRGAGFTEIDFHARRTLAGFSGSDLSGANLLVDLGGGFVAVDPQGGFAPPGAPLTLGNDGVVPGVAASRLRLARAGSPAVSVVRVRSLPTNVTFGFAGRPALFFQAGDLIGERATADFAELLRIYLAESGKVENGAYALPFALRSDSIARLKVTVEIEYLRTTSILPPGLPEAKIAYDLATVPRAGSAPLEVLLPAAAVPVAAASGGKVVGPFADSRIAWGPVGDPAGGLAAGEAAEVTVPIDPSRSAAQPLALPDRLEGYAISAVDLKLAALDPKVKLTLDLRLDDSDKPGAGSLLATPVPFERSRTGDGGNVWFSVELPSPLTLPADLRRVWVLLQSTEGEAVWSAAPAAPATPPAVPLQGSDDGGFSYRARLAGTGEPLEARVRLRERPAGFRMPLSVEVGEGANAVRVDLSRLSPLGKVAFDLSIPEISAGVSAALEKARGAGEAGGGELLADPSFARWGASGDEIGSPRDIRLASETTAPLVAFAPDGRIAVGVLRGANLEASLVAWDTETLAESWRLELTSGSDTAGGDVPFGLAVDPAGRSVFLLARAGLAVVDLPGRRPLGSIALSDGAFAPEVLALSADGSRLAVGGLADGAAESGPKIALFDAEALVGQIGRGESLAARLRTIDLDEEPIDLAFSPDGARLYTLTREPEVIGATASGGPIGRLSAHDLRLAGNPVEVLFDGFARRVVPTADGSAILVLLPNRLDRYDARTLVVAEPGLELPGQGYSSLAEEPGGARALLVGPGGLFAVRLGASALARLPVPAGYGGNGAVAVSPLGDRAAAVPFAGTGVAGANLLVQVIPLGTPRPLDWALTAGQAEPLSLSGSAGRGVRLGQADASVFSTEGRAEAPSGPSALSQVVAATPGRTYELAFFGTAQGEARAEVLWRAATGATLRIDAVPLDPAGARALLGSAEPALRRGRFAAPSETFAAEIRFVVEEGIALLRDASFREPENALSGGDLRGAFAAVWTQEPAFAPGFRVAAAGRGSRVSNAGAGTVTLRQQVAATPGAPFELRLAGRLEFGAPPVVGLRFLAADGAPVGESIELQSAAHAFDRALALGTVPPGAARAEVVLAVPAGGSFALDSIELSLAPGVRLPLTFLAEASGELSVVGGAIAWDLADGRIPGATSPSPRPRPTPTGTPLPQPTPPPGADDDCGCGCGDDPPAAAPAATPAPRAAPVEPLAIKGIGPRRAEILRARGVVYAADLLAADPRELARVLPGVSEKMAVEFIRQARAQRIRG